MVMCKCSSYKCCGLFITDLASGLSEVQLMDRATSEDVTRAIATFGNKHRIPVKREVDAGPQLKALTNNPISHGSSC